MSMMDNMIKWKLRPVTYVIIEDNKIISINLNTFYTLVICLTKGTNAKTELNIMEVQPNRYFDQLYESTSIKFHPLLLTEK